MHFPTKSLLFLALAHTTLARFGEENRASGPIAALGGGEAATLAGASISTLLAGSNACDKLALADRVAALPLPGALEAAKVLVQAEKNFNPFVVDRPSICDDASLPATAGLRGIIPLIDPAVEGADQVNAASAASLQNPLNQQGSTADLLRGIGFETFTAQNSAGGGGAAPPPPPPPPVDEGNNDNNDEVVDEEIIIDDGNNNNPPPPPPPPAVECPPVNNTPPPNSAPTGQNLQPFSGSLGVAIDPILFSGNAARPFSVAGATFDNFRNAGVRACDRQFNGCANVANSGGNVEFAECTQQKDDCIAVVGQAEVTSFDVAGARRRWVGMKRAAERRLRRRVVVERRKRVVRE